MKLKALSLFLLAAATFSASAVSITSFNTQFAENFDTLATTGTANTALPPGWALTETGGGARDNEAYGADTGGSNTGDTYSYGAAASTERALGGLRSSALIPVFGVMYDNGTGFGINSLVINYTGEQWRLGAEARGPDRLDFQYSLNASSLTTGTWIDVDALDFLTPNTSTVGAHDGNVAANRTVLSDAITGLNIAPGATFWLRWTDLDATGADDGLAVDNLSIEAQRTTASVPEALPSAFAAVILLGLLIVSRRFAVQPTR